MKRLPIGIQTFEKLVGEGFAYVDKTRFVADLGGEGGGYYFLSRPRRFGKSLFLSTIKAAFKGKRDLFRGLDGLCTMKRLSPGWSEPGAIETRRWA